MCFSGMEAVSFENKLKDIAEKTIRNSAKIFLFIKPPKNLVERSLKISLFLFVCFVNKKCFKNNFNDYKQEKFIKKIVDIKLIL